MARKAKKAPNRTAGRGNGEGESDENIGLITGEPQLDRIGRRNVAAENASVRPTETGEREAVPAATLDKVWTADSKERWGDQPMADGEPQPSFADLLASQREGEKANVESDRKAKK